MNWHAEGVGNSEQDAEAGIAAGTFKVGDVGTGDFGTGGQRLLSPALAFSSVQDLGDKAAADLFLRWEFHRGFSNQVK